MYVLLIYISRKLYLPYLLDAVAFVVAVVPSLFKIQFFIVSKKKAHCTELNCRSDVLITVRYI